MHNVGDFVFVRAREPSNAVARVGPHNSAAVSLLIAPTVAVLGLIATFLVVRSRYKEKQSLYETLRAERRQQIDKARRRAMREETPSQPPPATPPPATEVAAGPAPEGAPPSGVAAIRAEAIQRGRARGVVGVAALVGSLALILLGVILAIVESHLT